MKSSFARIFSDISRGNIPSDLVFPERKSIHDIKYNNEDLNPTSILVVEPFSESYSSKNKFIHLLVNQGLKKQYEFLTVKMEELKNEFMKKIKKVSKSTNAEIEIGNVFENKNIYEILVKLESEVNENKFTEYEYKYNDIINDKVEDFLKSNNKLLNDYIEKYNELISKSTFYVKSVFGTDGANNVNKVLSESRFFDANHHLILKSGKKIQNSDEFEKVIDEEKEKVLSDRGLRERFDKIDAIITKNEALRIFKKILETDQTIILKIIQFDKFKKMLWVNYFSSQKDEFNALVKEYISSQKQIKEIIAKANEEKTQWADVLELFNNRFEVPFKLKILNQDDMILKGATVPNIQFEYNQGVEKKTLDELTYKKVLSVGERRALYLLNVLFEIRTYELNSTDCLIIFDDIADSFDYKNKYAIIEYLKEIHDNKLFNTIILTHNYDFYRTVKFRLNICNCFMAKKMETKIVLPESSDKIDIFNEWVSKLEKDMSIFIASIPFARNLIQYIKGKNK